MVDFYLIFLPLTLLEKAIPAGSPFDPADSTYRRDNYRLNFWLNIR